MTSLANLVADIRRFLREHEMSPTVFGMEAMNDPGFVFDLEAGRSPGLRTVEKVVGFMKARDRFKAGLGRRK